MKKVIVAAVALIVVLTAAVGFYFYQNSKTPFPIDEILPPGPVFYFRAREISKNLDEFKATKLWQNLSQINLALLEEKSGLPPDQIKMTNDFLGQAGEVINSPEFKKFIGNEVAIAFYPAEIDMQSLESLNNAAANIILVMRLAPDARMAEFLSGVYKSFGLNPNIREVEYKKHKITLIEMPDQSGTLAYCMIKDLMVLGWSDRAARDCIDVLTKAKEGLNKDKVYITARAKFLNPSQTIIYGNFDFIKTGLIKYLMALADAQADDMKGVSRKQIEDSFSKLSGFKSLSLSAVPGKIAKLKFDWVFDKNQMDPDLKVLYSCSPKANASLSFIPQTILAYQWSNCLDARYYWQSIQKELKTAYEKEKGTQSNLEDEIKKIEDGLGLSIEGDIIPALGDEMGGYLADIETGGSFPIPQLVFFVKVGDKKAAEKVITKLTEQPMAALQSEDYSGTNIRYLSLPLGVNIEPAYCFLGDYLLISTSRLLLKNSIDASKSATTSLGAKQDFKDVNFGLTESNNTVLFLQIGELMRKIKTLAAWAADIADIDAQKKDAFREGAQKRLDDLKESISSLDAELILLRNQSKVLDQQIVDHQAQGIDASDIQSQLSDLQIQIEVKERSMELAQEQEPDLEATIEQYHQNTSDPQLLRLYLNEAVNPILAGLESFTAMGSWMRFVGDNSLESTVNIKVE